MQHHDQDRNPRYLSVPMLTISLFTAFLADQFSTVCDFGALVSSLIYLCALLIPIIVKRTVFASDDAWTHKDHSQHHVARLPRA